MKASLHSTTVVAKDTFEFTFTTEQHIDYTAGQFVEITLPHSEPDDRGIRRWFTLASAPEESVLKITTKKPVRPSSFKMALFSMQPGEYLEVSQAMGDFVMPRQRTIPVLFITAGVGITPVRSIITSLSLSAEQRTVGLIHINRETDPAYSHEIASYTNDIHHLQPEESLSHCIKLVVTALAEQPDLRVYISGPEQFVETLQTKLLSIVNPHRLVTDFFHGYN